VSDASVGSAAAAAAARLAANRIESIDHRHERDDTVPCSLTHLSLSCLHGSHSAVHPLIHSTASRRLISSSSLPTALIDMMNDMEDADIDDVTAVHPTAAADDRMPIAPLDSSLAARAASAWQKRKDMDERGEMGADESAASRVQSNVPAGASSSSSAMSFVVWRSSTWSELTVDFIESITTFLTLAELLWTSRVCRNWKLVTGEELNSRDDTVSLTRSQLLRLVSSPLRRHVATLDISYEKQAMLTRPWLKLVQMQLPQLRSLTCVIECTERPHDLHREFPALTTLDVRLFVPSTPSTAVAWSHVRRAMIDSTRVRTLTSLSISINSDSEWPDVKLSPENMPLGALQPLVGLRHSLTSLVFSCPNHRAVWPDSHLHIIRTLDGLTDLSFPDYIWTPNELAALTTSESAPMPLQLKRINLKHTFIGDEYSTSLAHLITLTAFEPHYVMLADASFLASFVQLEILRLCCKTIVDAPILLTAVACCSRIHTLWLSHPTINDANLTTLLSMLPHIRHVTLVGMDALTDLTFASAVSHLGVTLESLTIDYCRHISLASLSHLRALHALRRLELDESFDAVPDAHTLAGFTPSDPHFQRDKWPHLIHFRFSPHARKAHAFHSQR
jgi:hypothetical protein